MFEMPELTGSPKQIQWGNDIRLQFQKLLSEYLEDVRVSAEKSGQTAMFEEFYVMADIAFADMVKAQLSAKWWIDSYARPSIFEIQKFLRPLMAKLKEMIK